MSTFSGRFDISIDIAIGAKNINYIGIKYARNSEFATYILTPVHFSHQKISF